MGRREVSHQQVMSYLIGGGDYYTGHEFRTIRFHEFVDIAIAHEHHVDGVCTCGEPSVPDCPGNIYSSTCTTRTSQGSLSVVSDTLDYLMRPSASPFNSMSLWQFLKQTMKVRCTQGNEETTPEILTGDGGDSTVSTTERLAYCCRFRASFADDTHPQYYTHELCIRNTFMVPVLIGDSIPLPWKSDRRMEEFSRAMLLLFQPWRKPSDLLRSFSCWTEAFDAYEFPETSSQMISNF